MTDEPTSRPIVDPLGLYIFIPARAAADPPAAAAAARDHDPGRECYEPIGLERWQIRPVDPADEDDKFLIDEYGAQTVAEPADPGQGDEYWAVALDAIAIPEIDRSALELNDGDQPAVCVGQWCCGCKVHPAGKPWGASSDAWNRHRACQHPECV